MLLPLWDDLLRLIDDQPDGQYLILDDANGWRILLRLTDGAPDDEAPSPASPWWPFGMLAG
jgi:hypothetical protein